MDASVRPRPRVDPSHHGPFRLMEIIKRLLVDLWGRRRDDFDWRVDQSPEHLGAVESVLVLNLNGKLGDALMISLTVAALAEARPDLPIFVGTTAPYVDYWRRNPRVEDVVVLPNSRKLKRRMGRRIREARTAAASLKGRFDVVVSFEPYALPDHFALFRTLGARVNIGFNKHIYRLFTYSLEERRHGVAAETVAARTVRVMEVFGLGVDLRRLPFSVPFSPMDERAVEPLVGLGEGGEPRLLFNVYGAGEEKLLTPDSVVRAVGEIRRAGFAGTILLSVPPGTDGPYEKALAGASLQGGIRTIGPTADFFKLFALVSKMDFVVSPDTAIGHIAAAFQKPQVCLFAEGGTIPVAWKPFSERCASVLSTSGRNVNDVDWDVFARAIRWTLEGAALPSAAL